MDFIYRIIDVLAVYRLRVDYWLHPEHRDQDSGFDHGFGA